MLDQYEGNNPSGSTKGEKELNGHLFKKVKAVPIVALVCVFLLMTPPVLLLYYIGAFGVNMIFWDDWQNVSLVQKAMNNSLSFSDLFAQHNEHRMPFPNYIMTLIEILTQYNMIAVMLFSWILICLTGIFIFQTYRRHFKWNSYTFLLLIFLPVLLLLFSFRQWGSILWAITSQIYLMIFGVVASFSLLDRSKDVDIWFTLSLLSAILASFSFFAGLAVWPVGLFQIIITKRRNGFRQITSWGVVSVGVLITYFWGWVRPAYHPSLDYIFSHPIDAARYFFAFMGSLFGDSVTISEALGLATFLIVVSVLVYAHKSKTLRSNCIWFSLVLFATFFSLFITVGRSGFGVEQALSSRYTPVTSLGGVGVYFLALSAFRKKPGKRSLMAFGLLALIIVWIVFACLLGSYGGWDAGQSWRFSREIGAYVLLTYKIQSDENIRNYLFVDTGLVRNEAEFLEENRLNVFSQPVVDTSTMVLTNSDTLSALEAINGESTTGRSANFTIGSGYYETLTITGWAVDKQVNDVASAVFIIIDDEIHIPVIYGLDRPDVASSLKNPNFRFSGFMATFSFSILGMGKHSVSLEIVSKSGNYYYHQNNVLSLIVS
jgi:hypothetical protein